MSDGTLLLHHSGASLKALITETAAACSEQPFGAQYNRKKHSAVFRLWAPDALSVALNLYRTAAEQTPVLTVSLTADAVTGIWSGAVSEPDPEGMFYDYTLVLSGGGTAAVLDPYAVSMAASVNDGSAGRGAVIDMRGARSLPENGFSAPFVRLRRREDAVIYEISVRDFTIDPSAGTQERGGTFAAFIEKIPYLQRLGVTHVQLMPVVKFYNTDETRQAYESGGAVHGNNYNWGYDPHNYFSPSGWFSLDPADPYCRVRELRRLIDECHRARIGVLLDVVYNHMAQTRFLDDIVPGYYFRKNAGGFTSDSGCGNDTASERAMMRRLIVDSVRHWVQEYRVDGFRFDLMGLIDVGCVCAAYDAARRINPHTLFIGEGWKMYSGGKTVCFDQHCMTSTDIAGVFNDELRDLLRAGGMCEHARGFITGLPVHSEQLYRNMIGSPCRNYTADAPGDNVQYITAHDGLTLHDAVCLNCRLDSHNPEHRAEIVKRIKLGFFCVLVSQGIAFLHGGEELARTKPNACGEENDCIGAFVRNSYRADDSVNGICWKPYPEYECLVPYAAGLIALRKAHGVFRIGDNARIEREASLIGCADGGAGASLCLAYMIEHGGYRWHIFINADIAELSFHTEHALTRVQVFADAERAGARAVREVRGVTIADTHTVTLAPLTAAVVRSAKT